MLKRLLAIVTAFFATSALADDATPTISRDEIKVVGNVRTRSMYIELMVIDCAEHQGLSEEAIKQCLLNSKLFAEVAVKIERRNVLVTVEDRWTLIPVPMVTAGSGKSKRAGALLLETNFLGMGMTLGLGGTFSDSGNSYFGVLSDPSLFFSRWSYALIGLKQVDDVYLYEGYDPSDGFKDATTTGTLNIGYKLYSWNFSGAVSRQIKDFSVLDYYAPIADDAITRGWLTVAYDARNYQLYYSRGFNVKLSVTKEFDRSDHTKKITYLDGNVGYQMPGLSDHALQVQAIAGSNDGAMKQDAQRLGGGRGFRGMETKSSAAKFFYSGSADYQVPLQTLKSGTITAAPFIDVGRIQHVGGLEERTDFIASGGGVYFYLRSINLPGLGFEAGYNDTFQRRFFSFTAGFQQ